MTAEQLWQEYCQKYQIEDQKYDAWAFCGGGPAGDELATLVLEGKKTATASLLAEYEEDEELPLDHEYSVILWDNGEAAFVLQNYAVAVEEFGKVTNYHGYLEGEEERNLEAWRKIHKDYWALGTDGTEDYLKEKVVLEKFRVVYAADQKTEELLLVEPSEKYAEQIRAYRKAFLETGDSMDGCLSLKRMEDPLEWIQYVKDWADPSISCKPDGVKGTLLLCVRTTDDRVVGMIQMHHNLNTFLQNYAGHIGYSVLPGERRKGYAKWMLSKAIPYIKAMGFEQVEISCLTDNEASKRTILSNGGVFRDVVFVPEDGVELERYYL